MKRGNGTRTCMVCCKMKRRNNLVIYDKKDYNFESEHVKKAFSKNTQKTGSDIKYVCSDCYMSLKNVNSGSSNVNSMSKFEEADYLCTCCHRIFDNRKNVVLFARKKYDFTSDPAQTVLKKEFRCKKSMYEYICLECHSCLRVGKSRKPSIPPNAYCFQKDNVKTVGGVTAFFDWNETLQILNACINFDELERCVRLLDIPDLTSDFKGLRQMIHDKRDATAFYLIPDDVDLHKDRLFSVHTTGDGSCFYYALS